MVLFRSKKTKFHKQLLSNFQAEIRKSAKQLEAELKIGVAYKKKSVYTRGLAFTTYSYFFPCHADKKPYCADKKHVSRG